MKFHGTYESYRSYFVWLARSLMPWHLPWHLKSGGGGLPWERGRPARTINIPLQSRPKGEVGARPRCPPVFSGIAGVPPASSNIPLLSSPKGR